MLTKSDLIGTWIGTAPDGSRVSFTFAEDGSVIQSVNEKGFKFRSGSSGFKAKYAVLEGSPYWELDIFDFKDFHLSEIVFRGIVEPISANEFKMQGTPSNHGERPTDFDEEAILFTKKEPDVSLFRRLFRPGAPDRN